MDELFAGRMAEAREQIAKLTQHEASSASGVSRTSISRYETGDAEPRVDHLTALSRAYGVNPTWLLTGEEPKRWNPRASGESERERIMQALRIAGGWLLRAVDSELDVLGVVERGRVEAEDIAGDDRRDDSGASQQQDAV